MSEEIRSEKQRKLKIAELLKDLESGNAGKITAALDSLQVYGDATVIGPLVRLLDHRVSEESAREILEFLSSLKSSAAREKIMECLRMPEYVKVRQQLLSTIWNSPLDYSEYLAEFVELAVKEDFMITLECLTILENLEGPFDERTILEAQLFLKEYHEGKYTKDRQKDQLISEMAIWLKDTDRSLDS